MYGGVVGCAALAETVVFLNHFKHLRDPRQPGKVVYPLDEVLLLCLLGALAGAECFIEIALFGTKKLGLLRRFRPFKDGTQAHDHLGDILATLDADQFQSCFVAWVAAVAGGCSSPSSTWHFNLLRRPAGKLSLRGKRKAAAWDDEFLGSLIAPGNP